MKRTVFSLLAAFALCVSAAAAGPAVSCPSALLMEKQTGTVLFAQDEHTPREPASVTKIKIGRASCRERVCLYV